MPLKQVPTAKNNVYTSLYQELANKYLNKKII